MKKDRNNERKSPIMTNKTITFYRNKEFETETKGKSIKTERKTQHRERTKEKDEERNE